MEARDVVDYALQRRARLTELASGRVPRVELCDADPYLQSAARHYGALTSHHCPVCSKARLTHVHYVYGDALGRIAGQAKSIAELRGMDAAFEAFRVYLVEVCAACGWNQLVRSFVLGRERHEFDSVAEGFGV